MGQHSSYQPGKLEREHLPPATAPATDEQTTLAVPVRGRLLHHGSILDKDLRLDLVACNKGY